MNTLLPGEIFKNQAKMIEELLKGKESAARLRILLQQPFENDGSVSVEELTEKILRSFNETLSMMSFRGSKEPVQLERTDGSDPRPKISDKNRIQRRGCYRRRNATETGIKLSATIEDGYAWRKYGQKEILNSEYPRCYFRCTHKYDQGCKATKQVQKMRQDSLLYRITYFGHHTCNDTLRAPQIISETDPIDSCLLSFESKIPITKPDTLSSTAIINPTATSKETQSESSAGGDKSSVLSSCLWQDMVTSETGAHHEEVVSSFATQESLGGLDVVDFSRLGDLGSGLYFDENVFSQVLH